MGIKSIALGASALLLSTSVNAVVLNTLNGVDYQWLELTETQGLSRNAVEARLTDVNDEFYGYEYASRQLVEDLFLSYTPFAGDNGYYAEENILADYIQRLDDFGVLFTDGLGGDRTFTTADGYNVLYDTFEASYGMYGETGECGVNVSCLATTLVYSNNAGIATMALMDAKAGYSSVDPSPYTRNITNQANNHGSYLYKPAVVPVPAAVWLFGSGILGLVGMARRKA